MHCNVLPRFGPQGARLMALTSCAPIEAVTQVQKCQPFSACRWCRQDQLSYPSQTRPSCHLLVGLMTSCCGGRKVLLGQQPTPTAQVIASFQPNHPLPNPTPVVWVTSSLSTVFFRVHSSAAGNLSLIKPEYKLIRGHTVKKQPWSHQTPTRTDFSTGCT